MPTVGSLFSGIGGLDLGLEWAGFDIAWQCESDSYCREVLARHWPGVPCYEDVRTLPIDVRPVDVLAGGFPCQPVSLAGARRGTDDDRWLWPEYCRIIGLLRPRVVVVENVPGILIRGMGDVLRDLAVCGYDAEWDCISAASVGARHLRHRIFVVAYARGAGHGTVGGSSPSQQSEFPRRVDAAHNHIVTGHGEGGRPGVVADTDGGGRVRVGGAEPTGVERTCWGVFDRRRGVRGFADPASLADTDGAFGDQWNGLDDRPTPAGGGDGPTVRGCPLATGHADRWAIEPDVGRMAHGVPRRVDRLRTLGNAVVPQVAEWVGTRLLEVWPS